MDPEARHSDFEEDLTAHLQGELDPLRASELERHLDGCPACRRALAESRSVLEMTETVEDIVPSLRFKRRVAALLGRESREARQGFLEKLRTAGAYLLHRTRTSPRFRLAAVSVGVHTVLLFALCLIVFPTLAEDRQAARVEWKPPLIGGLPEGPTGGGGGEVPPDPDHPWQHHPEITDGLFQPPIVRPGELPATPILPAPRRNEFLHLRPVFATALADAGKIGRLATQLGDGEKAYGSVKAALQWLKARQARDGSWGPTDERGAAYRTAVTAASLLALLSDGHSMSRGREDLRPVVTRAVDRLVGDQVREGELKGLIGPSEGHYNYNHALATLALVETWSLDMYRIEPAARSARLRTAITDAIGFILRCQTDSGGWRYTLEDKRAGKADTSVTVFQMLALVSARGARFDVSGMDRAFSKFGSWLSYVTAPDGVVGYETPDHRPGDTRILTAGALFLEELLGLAAPLRRRQAAAVRRELTDPEGSTSKNGLLRFFAALAFRLRGESALALYGPALLDAQRRDGSWSASGDRHAVHAGDTFMTALNVLTLTSSYRWPS